MQRVTTFLLASALLAAGPAAAQSIEQWDTDGNGTLSQDEWSSALREQGLFGEFDTDGNGTVSEEEFATGLFGRFDDNGDSALSQEEWDTGFDQWFGEEAVEASWDEWNADGDDTLNQDEFVSSFLGTSLFEDFAEAAGVEDPSAGVGEDDFLFGLFDWFDEDDDDSVSEEEAGWFF